MKIWQKAMAGMLLLGGFAGYTQYQKSSEPVWKVNKEEFHVVKSLKEGMSGEMEQYQPVMYADYFHLLQSGNEEIQLPGDLRTVKIEKYWFFDNVLYVLYSVNLKETDKNEQDVPELSVKTLTYTLPDGTDKTFSPNYYNDQRSLNEFVHKHRLYRSMVVYPDFQEAYEKYWEEVRQSTRIKLDDLTMFSRDGERVLKPVLLKLKPFDSNKVLGSTKINQKLSFPGSGDLQADTFDIPFHAPQIRLKGNPEKKLAGFGGYLINSPNGERDIFEVYGPDEKGYFIPLNTYDMNHAVLSPHKNQSIMIDSVYYQTDESLSWIVTANEIKSFNKNKEVIDENEKIGTKTGITAYKQGFYYDGSQPFIVFSLIHENKKKVSRTYRVTPAYYSSQNESGDPLLHGRGEQNLKNLISIKNGKGENLKNFEVYPILNEETFGITFHDMPSLPEEDLTITLSHIVGIESFKEELKIKLKFPKRK